MIRISQLKLPCGADSAQLEKKIRRELHWRGEKKLSWSIHRHGIDARKKPQLFDVYTVDVETGFGEAWERKLLRRVHAKKAEVIHPVVYAFPPAGEQKLSHRPIIVGEGPAGLFAALLLSEHGYAPLVLERGREMRERRADVEAFWRTGVLNPASNVQFGEGGAGTFSDGKLNTLVNDKDGRSTFVLQAFVDAGAPGDILYEGKPHIGTDKLHEVIPALRRRIEAAGGEVLFSQQMLSLVLEENRVRGVRVRDLLDGSEREIPAEAVILAPGHSARDTIEALLQQRVPMEQKNFAVGFRVIHPQSLINQSRYGVSDPRELERLHLPSASYKLTARAASGRGVYSFCMCPGGYVVNASSEEGRIAVNGMSDYARDSGAANSAVVMTVGPQDFGGEGVLDGMHFQRRLEERAYALGQGAIPAEGYQELEVAFLKKHPDCGLQAPEGEPAKSPLPLQESTPGEPFRAHGSIRRAPLEELLPGDLTRDFLEGMRSFERHIHGYTGPEALVLGVESRTSSPVRIPRGEDGQSAVRGLFPCGEGAGYAGGIMSAAMDGMRAAEALRRIWAPMKQKEDGKEA